MTVNGLLADPPALARVPTGEQKTVEAGVIHVIDRVLIPAA